MFAFLEAVLWGLAGLGVISLPSSIPPTSADGFDARVVTSDSGTSQRLYEPDRWALTRMRANADISYPRAPIFPHGPERYHVRTNSAGMRDREISPDKPSGVLRIACLGDSSTFGYNVDDDETYPHRLQMLFDAAYPGRFQVLNFGVPGYTSLQGLEILKHRVLAYHPDIVTFAFGTNDRFWHGPEKMSARIRASQSVAGTMLSWLREAFNHTATYRGLRLLLTRTGTLPQGPSKQGPSGPAKVDEVQVGLDEIADAIAEAAKLGEQSGFSLIVLNIDLQRTDAVKATAAGAERIKVPFVNMEAMLRSRQAEDEAIIADRLGLARTSVPTRSNRLVFRVVADDHATSVLVNHQKFLDPKGVTEPMYDDGTHGDERAGDGVWSLATNYRPGEWVLYSYSAATGGAAPQPEYRDSFLVNGVPQFGEAKRKLVIDIGAPYIDTFGTMRLRADAAHPNEEAQGLIAARLRDEILTVPGIQNALAKR